MVNEGGELLSFFITPSNIDDRRTVPKRAEKLFGKLIADRGYISKGLTEQLLGQGVQLVTKIKVTRKERLLPLWDKILLRKRALIETVFFKQHNYPKLRVV
jgi:hypothetical protein